MRQHTTSRDAAAERKDNVSEKVQQRYHFPLLKLRYDVLHYPWPTEMLQLANQPTLRKVNIQDLEDFEASRLALVS